jgi:hypothetical protein
MKRIYSRYIFLLFGIFALTLGSFGQIIPESETVDHLFTKEGEQFFSFNCTDRILLDELSHLISIDKVERQGKVFAYANRKEFSRFLEYGIEYEILPHPGDFEGNLNIKDHIDVRGIQEWDFYPTYGAYEDIMYQFAESYPSMCQVFSIGTTPGGREILIAKISANVGISENEPQLLYTSSIHGDELTGYILMLRLIDYLLSNYGSLPKITSIVDNTEIWINPLSNPDGTYAGGNNTVNGARRYNANWIDLNRNYADPEDGPHPDGEEWQPETMLFMDMAQENHFVTSINFHGGEEVCNYPWDTWSRLAADDNWWQYVCHEYADTVHLYSPPTYMSDFDNGITNGYAWYSISGGRQDYMNFFHQAREFTLEISDIKLPSPELLPSYWDYNYRSLLNFIEQSAFGLRGTVKDSISGWPIRAEVYAVLHELDSSWVYSALPNGNYHRLLFAGTYTIKYSAPGYETKIVHDVVITNRQATVLDVKLAPDGVGGIDNYLVSSKIEIFPNPTHNGFLSFYSDLEIYKTTVYDIQGKILLNTFLEKGQRKIGLEGLKPGIYFVRFDTEKGIGMKKIVVSE